MTRAASGSRRLMRAWRSLPHERRLAALAASGVILSSFLPWYDETVLSPQGTTSVSVSGWGAFSFSEALLLLTAGGVLWLLFQRAEGRTFHLPGGDGIVVLSAGAWASLLVLWRILERPTADVRGSAATLSGVSWGIFLALAAAGALAYAGQLIRAAAAVEPPAHDDLDSPAARPSGQAGPRQPARAALPTEQLTIPLEAPESD